MHDTKIIDGEIKLSVIDEITKLPAIDDTELLEDEESLEEDTESEFQETDTELDSSKLFLDLGIVISISDGIVGISGLDNVANGEVIEFVVGSKRIVGMVLNLEPEKVSAVVLGDDSEIKPGQYVFRKLI
jgi:F0F1-type ATP synthase alpha subunit